MILVSVGAYDLPYDRLVQAVDRLAGEGVFKEPVFAQIGHSAEPTSGALTYERFLGFNEIQQKADEASLIITQGGPGSIMLGLGRGKVPIVVPRRAKYNEMPDDHQLLFAEKMSEEKKILLVHEVEDLKDTYLNYDILTSSMNVSPRAMADKAREFSERLEQQILHLYQGRASS